MHRVANSGEDYNFEEFCPRCEEPIPIIIDEAEHNRYEITCPKCKKQMMLCTLCIWDYHDVFGGTDYLCDWDEHHGCYRQRRGDK